MNRIALALIYFCSLALGQEPPQNVPYFVIVREATSTTAESLGVTLPANSATRVHLVSAWVYCSAGGDATQTQDSTLSGTTVTPVAVSIRGATSAVTAVRSLTPSGGSSLPTIPIPAGQAVPIPLNSMILPAGNVSAASYRISAAPLARSDWRCCITR